MAIITHRLILSSLFLVLTVYLTIPILQAAHIQKYYFDLKGQKFNISDMFSFGEIGSNDIYYSVNKQPNLNIAIFIGSDDNNGLTNKLKLAALMKILQESCLDGIYACGMKKSNSDSNTLLKNDIRLHFYYSNSKNGYIIRTLFEKSFQDNEIVIYIGHSRRGGGPDFYPAVYHRGTRRLNFNYYNKKKGGLRSLKKMIMNAPSPRLLALLSCKSKKHFSSLFTKQKLVQTLLTSELIPSSNMDKVLLTLLNHLFSNGAVNLNESIVSTIGENNRLIFNPHY